MGTQLHPAIEKMVFRNTNRHLGRHISVTPGNSTNRHLSYGRIILNRSTPSVSFSNGNHETGLICLSGSGTVQKDSTLKFTTGRPGSVRQVSICLGKNIEAGRLLLGFTISDPGNWTSWPPHEHAEMLEEMYVYFDMPRPAYGIQLVYNDTESPELLTVVRDGDAILIPRGYHPNVSLPGHRITFLWAMAAHREKSQNRRRVRN
jgi:5-deoxy-D-glucuronate isomerase